MTPIAAQNPKRRADWLLIVIVVWIGGIAFLAAWRRQAALRMKGGIRAVLQADVGSLPNGTAFNSSQVRRILENRLSGLGVSGATVEPRGSDEFVVELPNVPDKQGILKALCESARMRFYNFKDVDTDKNAARPYRMTLTAGKSGDALCSFTDVTANVTFRDGAHIRDEFDGELAEGTASRPGAKSYTIPVALAEDVADPQVYFTSKQQNRAQALNGELKEWRQFINSEPVVLTSADIEPDCRALISRATSTIQPVVTQEFTDKGAQEMSDFTSTHIGDYLGIVMDDKVIEAPNIRGTISDQGEISGGFHSLAEAERLATLLNTGELPAPLTVVKVEAIK